MQHSLHADAAAEFQGRSGGEHDVELLRTEGDARLPEPQHLPRRRVVRRLLHGGIRVHEGARCEEEARHGIRHHHRTDLPALPASVAHGAAAFGGPAPDQGGAVGQFPGSSLLPPHAVERRHRLHVEQQPLFVVLAAAGRYQRGECTGPGRVVPDGGQSRFGRGGADAEPLPAREFQHAVHRRTVVRIQL